jgi:hypothetical protein
MLSFSLLGSLARAAGQPGETGSPETTQRDQQKRKKAKESKMRRKKNMKKWSRILPLIIAAGVLAARDGLAQFKPESGSIDGYMVMEYYSVLQHHDPEAEGRNGFWFRRIYFTYNNKLSDTVKMRFRLEMDSPGQFGTSALLTPFVKDAYLSLKIGKSELIGGIQSPPSFDQLEAVWGWRPLEKTPLDLQRWTSSRDFGISLKGGKAVPFHLMFANGSSNKAEIDKGKKFFGSLGYKSGGFFLEGMAQYEHDTNAKADDTIGQVFGTYSSGWGRVGLQYSHRSYKRAGQGALPYNIISAFGVFAAGGRVEFIGRIDWSFGKGYKEDFAGSKVEFIPFADNHEFTFFIGAVSWQVVKNVWLLPNLKFTAYKENDLLKSVEGYVKPENDLYANLTLYFKF